MGLYDSSININVNYRLLSIVTTQPTAGGDEASVEIYCSHRLVWYTGDQSKPGQTNPTRAGQRRGQKTGRDQHSRHGKSLETWNKGRTGAGTHPDTDRTLREGR